MLESFKEELENVRNEVRSALSSQACSPVAARERGGAMIASSRHEASASGSAAVTPRSASAAPTCRANVPPLNFVDLMAAPLMPSPEGADDLEPPSLRSQGVGQATRRDAHCNGDGVKQAHGGGDEDEVGGSPGLH